MLSLDFKYSKNVCFHTWISNVIDIKSMIDFRSLILCMLSKFQLQELNDAGDFFYDPLSINIMQIANNVQKN